MPGLAGFVADGAAALRRAGVQLDSIYRQMLAAFSRSGESAEGAISRARGKVDGSSRKNDFTGDSDGANGLDADQTQRNLKNEESLSQTTVVINQYIVKYDVHLNSVAGRTDDYTLRSGETGGESVPRDGLGGREPTTAEVQGREQAILRALGKSGESGITPSTALTALAGASAVAYGIYLGAMMAGTHRNRVRVTGVRIEYLDQGRKKVFIEIDRSNIYYPDGNLKNRAPDSFNPCVGDALSFNSNCLMPTGKEYTIRGSRNGGRTIEIIVPDTDLTNFADASNTQSPIYLLNPDQQTPYTRDFTRNLVGADCYVTVYSSFTNQMFDGLFDVFTSLFLITADALSDAASGAVNLIYNLGSGAARAGGQAFCSIVPILCDKTFWIIIFLAVVCVIILMAVT